MKKIILILFICFIYQSPSLATIHKDKEILKIDDSSACTLFRLRGVGEADPVAPGNTWFAIPHSSTVHDAIVSMLFRAKSTGKTLTVSTTGSLACSVAEVERVSLLPSGYVINTESTSSATAKPDLEVYDVKFSGYNNWNEYSWSFTYKIKNNGTVATEAVTAQAVISNSDKWACRTYSKSIPALEPGQIYSGSWSIGFSNYYDSRSCAGNGTNIFYWRVIVDPSNKLDETNETNNIGTDPQKSALIL